MPNIKQSGLILSTIVCEFFSYFGIRALLILYLSQQLNFTDKHAYALFGAFTALIFLTPIAGGYVADRWLGFYRAVFLGVLLIIAGEVLLICKGGWCFYLALALLVAGLGFFKTNAICLYQRQLSDSTSKNSAMSIYYVALNLGGSLGPLVNGFVAEYLGFEWAFALSAIMMLFGLITLKMATRNQAEQPPLGFTQAISIFVILALSIAVVTLVLAELWAGYLVAIATVIALVGAYFIYRGCDKPTQKRLIFILVLTLLSTLYWTLDQQGGSSVMLFINRNVNRGWLPTASFSGISSLGTVLFGLFLAWIWQRLTRSNRDFSSAYKLLIGFGFLGAGFALLTWGATVASTSGECSWIYPLAGLGLISLGELFTDPVIVSEIAQAAPARNLGFLTGMYFLFVGAVANYLSGWVAQLTAIPKSILSQLNQSDIAHFYANGFEWMLIAVVTAGALVLFINKLILT